MNVVSTLNHCDSILEKITEVEENLDGRAIEFAGNVKPMVEGIQKWVEGNSHCTPKQKTTLENIEYALDKWLTIDPEYSLSEEDFGLGYYE